MIRVENLTIKYGARVAVDEVSFRLDTAEIMTVIGPNGAGKSTLLRALNGGIRPASGSVLINGKQLSTFSRRTISRRIAVVAQEADLRFPVTVLEFVLGGRYAWGTTAAWGWETEKDLATVNEVLEETELTSLQTRLMSELSGGERQRCLLGRALAAETPLLLLDEPTANMDLAHQESILALVRRRCDKRGTAAIVITHDINLAAHFSDQVMLLQQGSVVAIGTPEEVLTTNLMKKVFDVEVLVDAHPITGVPRVTPVHRLYRQGN
ncbi:MAG TPA: ABC transporter ATP-binding protein [Pyrinomonadaceae bacterium]